MILNKNVFKIWIKALLGREIHINMYNLHYSVRLYGKKNIIIDKTCTIAENVIVRAHGKGKLIVKGTAQIGPNTTILVGDHGITISNAVMIGPNCVIVEGKHDFRQKERFMNEVDSFSNGPIVIEEDVWIAANCTIGDNVTIGSGSVIGANSFVNKDVGSYEIHGGIPAKKLTNRI